MQNDFIDGVLGTPEAQAIVEKVKEKISEYKKNGSCIIYTRDTHTSEYLKTNEGKNLPVEHCIENTHGWCIADGLFDLDYPNSIIINKPTFGYNDWDLYSKYLEKGEIELVGLCTDICVVSNALILKAKFPETTISVDARCCAGVTPEKHNATLEVMRSCQIKVIGE
jgi:nicotinamidase-related amidase